MWSTRGIFSRQHFLNFFWLPHGHGLFLGSFRIGFHTIPSLSLLSLLSLKRLFHFSLLALHGLVFSAVFWSGLGLVLLNFFPRVLCQFVVDGSDRNLE